MFNFKEVIDNKIFQGFEELSKDLTKKFQNRNVLVYFGVDQDRMTICKKVRKVKSFNIVENDSRFEKIGKFNKMVYIVVLTDIDNNNIWLGSLDFID